MEKPTDEPTPEPLPNKVAVVVTKIFYHEDEYNAMVDSLLDAGFEVVVVGAEVGTVTGFNETTTVEMAYEQVDAQKLLGIVLIGGDGAMSLWKNAALHSLLSEVDALGRVVAAIGTAAPTLAIAGVITEGESACWFSGIGEVSWIMYDNGIIDSKKLVTISSNAITANGSQAKEEFAFEVVKALKELKTAE